ncbi:hypothetical protein HS088_TW09G00244 [Tripterygium wilfordii]|uniref:Uncharacterized protein n=1 Tax=Tripterygium wilfordii TaxID=458696 RepID=A0A7J7D7C0_TRIWF|nr:hypothetical protein HS088_TW09G00244 [Tripterygium wilfordii]
MNFARQIVDTSVCAGKRLPSWQRIVEIVAAIVALMVLFIVGYWWLCRRGKKEYKNDLEMKLSEAMKVRGCRGVKEGSRVRSLQISVRSGIGARIIRPVKEGKGFWLCNFRRRFGRERRVKD